VKICKTVAEGVNAALAIYQVTPTQTWEYVPAAPGDYTDTLVLDGIKYPLFWWHCDTQISQMYRMAPSRKLCSMKLNRTCAKSMGLDALLYKELDIAEHMFRCEIQSVMAMENEHSMNMLATMEQQQVALFELAATLNDNTPEQGRHSYWGEDGMASDRVVSQKIPSEAIYLFTEDEKDPTLYNDIFIYMYGLSKTDVLKATTIAEILMGRRDCSNWIEKDAHYRRCIAAAHLSNQLVKCVNIQEVSL